MALRCFFTGGDLILCSDAEFKISEEQLVAHPPDLETLLLRHRNMLKYDEQVLCTGDELSTGEEKPDINSLEFISSYDSA